MLYGPQYHIKRLFTDSYKTTRATGRLPVALALCGLLLAAGIAQGGTIDLSTDPADHVLTGAGENSYTGQTVLIGDVNGDGRDDMIVGARGFDHGGRTGCGVIYVLFASDTLSSKIELGSNRPDLKRIVGPATNSQIGTIVGCGDVDHDGRDDIVCGIPLAAPNGKSLAGEVYVVFGSDALPDTVDLLTPPAGVTRIEGANTFDKLGESVTIADIDNDTFGDIIAGAPFATTPAGSFAGKVFVVYGGESLDAVIDLASTSARTTQVFGAHSNDILGGACYAADVTGDTIVDLIAGAPQESPLGRSFSGVAYIIPGSPSLPDTIDLAANSQLGITRIYGPEAGTLAGSGFASGDVDGNGLTDLLVAVPEAAPHGRLGAGSVYILRDDGSEPLSAPAAGQAWPEIIDLQIPPLHAIRIDGPATNMKIGSSIAVSDFNMDGYDDIAIGVHLASPPGILIPRKEAGITHILFGRQEFPATIDLAAEQTGKTMIYGAKPYDHAGYSVAAGRLDGDDFEDIMIGANNAEVGGQFSMGEVAVLFGSPEITPTTVLFYNAKADRGSVTIEWALKDDLPPQDIVVTRSSGTEGERAESPLTSEIARLGAGHYLLVDTAVDGGASYTYEAATQGADQQILFRITVNVPRFANARLSHNSPNPFRKDTVLSFEIPAEGRVRVRVFDVTGSEVAVLADGVYAPGVTALTWDGRNRDGLAAASGVYFVRMDYGKQSLERKILIVR